MNTSCSQCNRPARARGLCEAHYYGSKRLGTLDEIAPKRFDACQNCGGEIPATRRFGSRFCSPKCKENRRAHDQEAAVAERRLGRTCVQCRQPIPITAGGKAITCSRVCGVAWQNDKRAVARRAAWDLERKPCPQCGKKIPDERRAGSIYCSPECRKRALDARWRAKSPGYMRQYLYGLTPEQYAALLASQGGRCAICRADTPGGKGGWHVDHDHATRAIRGLLCHGCNLMLGNAGDNTARLRAAAEYLERAPA